MPETRSTVFAQPGDLFVAGKHQPKSALQSVTLCANAAAWFVGPLTIHATVDTLLGLADSLVASAMQLENDARDAAAPFTPADPEQAAEG